MPTNSDVREERIEFLIQGAHKHLGNALYPYDRILVKARKKWPTLDEKTIASYALAATRAYLTGGVLVQRTLVPYSLTQVSEEYPVEPLNI